MTASTSSDAKYEADPEDEVFSDLSREELVNVVKDLISHHYSKSKKFKVSQEQYDLVTKEAKKLNIVNENIRIRNGIWKKINFSMFKRDIINPLINMNFIFRSLS